MGKIKEQVMEAKRIEEIQKNENLEKELHKVNADIRIPLHQYAYVEFKVHDTVENIKKMYDHTMRVFKQENVISDESNNEVAPGTRTLKTAKDIRYDTL